MTFRMIDRALQERSFLRTELRRELSQQRSRSGVSEYQQRHNRGRVALTSIQMRQHFGGSPEKHEANCPTLAPNSSRLCASRCHSLPLAVTCCIRYDNCDLHKSGFLLVTAGEK